jgi:tRNA(Ile)-lysidine synthase
VPGRVVLPGVGTLRAERRTVQPAADALSAFGADRNEAWLDADVVAEPLQVRWRQPGDRFQPLGMESPKRLQDFLVDSRVPRARRDRLPLVVAGEDGDAIVWAVRVRIAHWARVRPETRETLHLTFAPEAPDDCVAGT